MFEKLLIQNFQAHSKLKIEFDPRLTVIVGPSDVGKSAVIRALRWVCRNHPQGQEFIRHGTSGTIVKLFVDDVIIERRRGKTINAYKLDAEKYVSFGTNVPDTIDAVLNVNDINFQNQHDAVYWFSETAGEVSRRLNSVVDLGIIDESLSSILKTVNNLKKESEINRERLKEAKLKVKELKWVEDADIQLKRAEKLNAEIIQKRGQVEKLTSNLNSIRVFSEKHEYHTYMHGLVKSVVTVGARAAEGQKGILSLQKTIDGVNKAFQVIQVREPCINALNATLTVGGVIKLTQKSVNDLECNLAEVVKLNSIISLKFPKIKALSDMVAHYTDLERKKQGLIDLLNRIKSGTSLVGSRSNRLAELNRKYSDYLKDGCPVCGKPMEVNS